MVSGGSTATARGAAGFCLIIIATYAGIPVWCNSLRMINFDVPEYAERGSMAELLCQYETKKSELYSVKWFKDDQEFFRYVPRDRTQYQVFHLAGLHIDGTSYEPSRVVLRDLSFAASGQYRCEITNEGPNFITVTGHGSMQVVEPISSNPNLIPKRYNYTVNDTVEMTCTSSPSRPPAQLTWQINNKQVKPDFIINFGTHPQPDGLIVRTSEIRFNATPEYFENGQLLIKCIASLSKLKEVGDKYYEMLASFTSKWENSFLVSSGGHLESDFAMAVTSVCISWLFCVLFSGFEISSRICDPSSIPRLKMAS